MFLTFSDILSVSSIPMNSLSIYTILILPSDNLHPSPSASFLGEAWFSPQDPGILSCWCSFFPVFPICNLLAASKGLAQQNHLHPRARPQGLPRQNHQGSSYLARTFTRHMTSHIHRRQCRDTLCTQKHPHLFQILARGTFYFFL